MLKTGMTLFLKKGESHEVILNGPIRTGIEIDSRLLLVKGYATTQENLRSELTERLHGLWNYPSVEGRANGMAVDIDDKRGRTVIPKFFMSRILQADVLVSVLNQHNLPLELHSPYDPEKEQGPAATYIITKAEIRMYDFGYGAVMFYGQLRANRDISLQEFRSAGEQVGSQLNDYGRLYDETFDALSNLIPPESRLVDITKEVSSETTPEALSMRPRQGMGRLLWVHRVFLIKCRTPEEFDQQKEACKLLVYSATATNMPDLALTPGLSFYGGDGNSAAIYDATRVPMKEVMLLPRIIQAHNVYFSKAEEYDYALFYFNNDLSLMRDISITSGKMLEERSRHVIEFKSQITFFRSLYTDYDNHLEPQSRAIWFGLAEAWHTDDRFNGIEAKLTSLEKIYDRMVQELNGIQNKKLNAFVLVFTLLSMLSVAVDTIDFTQGDSLQAPALARLGILLLMALVMLVVAGRLVRRA